MPRRGQFSGAADSNDDKDPVSPGIKLPCELPQFNVRKWLGLIPLDFRKADTCRGIPGKGPVLHCVVEDTA